MVKPRRLLAFQAALNFGPAGAPAVDGYSSVGLGVYPSVVDGMTVGWSGTGPTADRRTSGSAPDDRFRSYVRPYSYTLGSARKFEVALPNGTYRVRAVAGTPDEHAGNGTLRHRFLAEGSTAIVDGTTSASTPFVSGVANVTVSDGRLSITLDAAVAPNARLAFVDIVEAARASVAPAAPSNVVATAASTTSVNLTWADNADNEGRDPATVTLANMGEIGRGYQVERRQQSSGGAWGAWSTVGYALASATRYRDAGLTNGATYAYRVSAVNNAGASALVEANGSVAPTTPGAGFQTSVNFGPDGSAAVSGYRTDLGNSYNLRSNGRTFGWVNPTTGAPTLNSAGAFERASESDQRLDTGIGTQNLAWELAVPNGTYFVKLVAGDANVSSGTYKYDVEGSASFLNGSAGAGAARWVTATGLVTVSDGKLTIKDAGGANHALAYVEVTSEANRNEQIVVAPTNVVATTAGTGVADVRWTDKSDNETGFKVERATDPNGTWATLGTTYANAMLFTDAAAVGGTIYYYRVTATGLGGASAAVASNAIVPPTVSGQMPYNPTRQNWTTEQPIGGEDFDAGGQNVSFNDDSDGNAGGYYRGGDADVGYNVVDDRYFLGWHKAGEWREYTVDVPTSGLYELVALVASDGVGGKFDVAVDGANKAIDLQVPDTGSFNTYGTLASGSFELTAGTGRVVRMTATDNDNTGYWVGDIDWFKLVRVGDLPTAQTPVVTIAASPTTVNELNTERAVFTVTRDVVTSSPLTIAFTLGGAATNGTDYVLYDGATGTTALPYNAVTIQGGMASATFSLVPIEDAVDEGTGEQASVTLAASTATPASYTLGTTNAAGVTIADDDGTGSTDIVLTGSAPESDEVDLSWSSLSAYDDYRVEMSADGVEFDGSSEIEAGLTSYEFGGFDAGESFYFRVIGRNGGTDVSTSNIVHLTTPGTSSWTPGTGRSSGGGSGGAALTVAAATSRLVVGFNGYYLSTPFESEGNKWFERIVRETSDTVKLNATQESYNFDDRRAAYDRVLTLVDTDSNQIITAAEASSARIAVLGYSLGGVEAVNFCLMLAKTDSYTMKMGGLEKLYVFQARINVDCLVTLDPVTGGLAPLRKQIRLEKGKVTDNVLNFVNYYETRRGTTSFRASPLGSSNNGTSFENIPRSDVSPPVGIGGIVSGTIRGVKLKTTLQNAKQINLSNSNEVFSSRYASNVAWWPDSPDDSQSGAYDIDLTAGGVEHLMLPWYVRGGLDPMNDSLINVAKDLASV